MTYAMPSETIRFAERNGRFVLAFLRLRPGATARSSALILKASAKRAPRRMIHRGCSCALERPSRRAFGAAQDKVRGEGSAVAKWRENAAKALESLARVTVCAGPRPAGRAFRESSA